METGSNALTRLYTILDEMRKLFGNPVPKALNIVIQKLGEDEIDLQNPLYGLKTVIDLCIKSHSELTRRNVPNEERESLEKIQSYFLNSQINNDVNVFNQHITDADFKSLKLLVRVVDSISDGVIFNDVYSKIKDAVEKAASELDKLDLDEESKNRLMNLLYGFLSAVCRYKWDGKDGLTEEIDKFFGRSVREYNRGGLKALTIFNVLWTVSKTAFEAIDSANNLDQLPNTIQSVLKILGN